MLVQCEPFFEVHDAVHFIASVTFDILLARDDELLVAAVRVYFYALHYYREKIMNFDIKKAPMVCCTVRILFEHLAESDCQSWIIETLLIKHNFFRYDSSQHVLCLQLIKGLENFIRIENEWLLKSAVGLSYRVDSQILKQVENLLSELSKSSEK
jgi:hypothetical protein